MRTSADLVPAKEHDGDKRGFHKECQNTFDCQRSAEDIAYEPTVVRPVRTELKFQDQTGSDSNRKIDTEEFHPEFGCFFPKLFSGTVVDRFHHGHHNSQPEGERNE